MKRGVKNYRDVVDFIETTPKIRRILNLSRMPKLYNITKFFERFSSNMLNKIFNQTVKMLNIQQGLDSNR